MTLRHDRARASPCRRRVHPVCRRNRQLAVGPAQLRAYPILPDNTLGPHTVLHAFGAIAGEHRGIEGMCVDAKATSSPVPDGERPAGAARLRVFR